MQLTTSTAAFIVAYDDDADTAGIPQITVCLTEFENKGDSRSYKPAGELYTSILCPQRMLNNTDIHKQGIAISIARLWYKCCICRHIRFVVNFDVNIRHNKQYAEQSDSSQQRQRR